MLHTVWGWWRVFQKTYPTLMGRPPTSPPTRPGAFSSPPPPPPSISLPITGLSLVEGTPVTPLMRRSISFLNFSLSPSLLLVLLYLFFPFSLVFLVQVSLSLHISLLLFDLYDHSQTGETDIRRASISRSTWSKDPCGAEHPDT